MRNAKRSVREVIHSIGDNTGSIVKRVGGTSADLARSVGRGTAGAARRVGARRAIIGFAVLGAAIGASIVVARYRRRRVLAGLEREAMDVAESLQNCERSDRRERERAGALFR